MLRQTVVDAIHHFGCCHVFCVFADHDAQFGSGPVDFRFAETHSHGHEHVFVSVTQNVLLNLAHRVAGKFIHNDQLARMLEPRQTFTYRPCYRIRIGSLAGLCHDDTNNRFTEIWVRHADHGAFQYSGLIIENQLDLFGVNVVTARDDKILVATNDMDVAIVVDAAQITGDEKAVVAQFGSGFFQASANSL